MTKFKAIYSYLIFSMISVSSNLKVSEMDSLLPFSIGDEMERFVLSVTLLSTAASSSAKTSWFLNLFPSLLSVRYSLNSFFKKMQNFENLGMHVPGMQYWSKLQSTLNPPHFAFRINNLKSHLK